jgi:hypothetical protein
MFDNVVLRIAPFGFQRRPLPLGPEKANLFRGHLASGLRHIAPFLRRVHDAGFNDAKRHNVPLSFKKPLPQTRKGPPQELFSPRNGPFMKAASVGYYIRLNPVESRRIPENLTCSA